MGGHVAEHLLIGFERNVIISRIGWISIWSGAMVCDLRYYRLGGLEPVNVLGGCFGEVWLP